MIYDEVSAVPSGLGKAERAILGALSHFPEGASRNKVALIAGYSPGGGAYGNALSRLRSARLIEGSDLLIPTAAGLAEAGEAAPLPTGEALLAFWLGHPALGLAAREVLKAVVAGLPGRVSRETVAAEARYEASGGAFGNALSKLRTLGLITGSAELQAAEEFA